MSFGIASKITGETILPGRYCLWYLIRVIWVASFERNQFVDSQTTYTSFAGTRLIVSGDQKTMLLRTKEFIDRNSDDRMLIFVDQTGEQVDFDFRGTPADVLKRVEPQPPRTGPGRPKLGVVAREVTLLPRHWEWLEQQPNGASAALRRLVDDARKKIPKRADANKAIEAASRFMWAMAGDLENFEEASRALFAKDRERLQTLIQYWPADVRGHLLRLVQEAMPIACDSSERPIQEDEPAVAG